MAREAIATTVTLIVPVYNEGPALGASLVRLSEQFSLYSCYDVQFVIVDDGSTDETGGVAERFARFRRSAIVLTHTRTLGFGAALRSGLARAAGEYTIVIAAHASYTPFAAMLLLETLHRENADVAVLPPRLHGFAHLARAYRTKLMKELDFRCDGIDSNAQLLSCALRRHARIVIVPVSFARSEPRARFSLAAFASKCYRIFTGCGSAAPAQLESLPPGVELRRRLV